MEAPQKASEEQLRVATDEESTSPNQCLFCQLTFDNDETGEVEEVIQHMSAFHGLFIPDLDLLSNPASLLGYLATQIRVWHECLYCGITRTSTSAIQSHMRDSGHCMLNFEKEPELSEFWERRSDQETGLTDTRNKLKSRFGESQHLRLVFGKNASSNSSRRPRTQAVQARSIRPTLPAGAESSHLPESPRLRTCRQLARRDEMGLQNMSFQQRNALVVAVKRSQKEEAMARRAKEWTYARKANDQKHDQNYGALAWAKGGMHNLLPR